eukprot:scaffold215457_cov24-Attheya_sp.AAC.2
MVVTYAASSEGGRRNNSKCEDGNIRQVQEGRDIEQDSPTCNKSRWRQRTRKRHNAILWLSSTTRVLRV